MSQKTPSGLVGETHILGQVFIGDWAVEEKGKAQAEASHQDQRHQDYLCRVRAMVRVRMSYERSSSAWRT